MRRELSQAGDLAGIRTSYQKIMARAGALLVSADRSPDGKYAIFQFLHVNTKEWLLEHELELFARSMRLFQLFNGSRDFGDREWDPTTWGTADWSDDMTTIFNVMHAIGEDRIPDAACD